MAKVLVFSHKEIWKSKNSPTGWATDGGFVFHMMGVGSIFDEIEIITPEIIARSRGEVFFKDSKLHFSPFRIPKFARGYLRKFYVLIWGIFNLPRFVSKIRKADLVHTPVPSDFGTVGMILAKWMNKPLLIRYCGDWLKPRTLMERYWIRFINNNAGKTTIAFATGGGEDDPSSINSRIDWIFSSSLNEADLRELRSVKKRNDDDGIFKIVTVSRQVYKKGTDITLRALALLQDKRVLFDVVGNGPDLSSFIKLSEELGISDQVVFHGQLNNNEVLNILHQADVFSFPCTSEGFPKVVIEAMATGLPVITNHVSVLPSLINGSNSGIVMEKGSPEELAEQLRTLQNNTELKKTYSKNAQEYASNYTLEKWTDLIAEKLRSELGGDFHRKREIVK